jgi:hypothetical protein
MALIVRIDVDRPYGKHPAARHILSRVSSDLYFPRAEFLGYLTELATILRLMNQKRGRAHVFFRRCTLPSKTIMNLLDEGNHAVGLHLENSRSFESFEQEKTILERHIGRRVATFTKHGSGGARYGFHHHAPYEADKYIEWGQRAQMKAFFGNLEDPTLRPTIHGALLVYPSAFWLEPAWRDTNRFTVDWLAKEALARDIVLLIHPENVLESQSLTEQFTHLLTALETKFVESVA